MEQIQSEIILPSRRRRVRAARYREAGFSYHRLHQGDSDSLTPGGFVGFSKGAPWQVVIFSLGMYLVVYGLKNAGLTDHISQILNTFAGHGIWGASLGTGLLTALLSSIMNNLPTVLVGALSIQGAEAHGVVQQAMVYANIIGCDLGPKITPIGSLATLLWLHVLAKKNTTITWGYYFKTWRR